MDEIDSVVSEGNVFEYIVFKIRSFIVRPFLIYIAHKTTYQKRETKNKFQIRLKLFENNIKQK